MPTRQMAKQHIYLAAEFMFIKKESQIYSSSSWWLPRCFLGEWTEMRDEIPVLGEINYLGSGAFELHNTEVAAPPWNN